MITAEESFAGEHEHESAICDIPIERNVTLRTDYPGGALPLHSVAACPTFDCTSLSNEIAEQARHSINKYLPSTDITPNVISAYISTTIIRQACPQAVWDRDCEGEIPLSAAASWGDLGAVLSLLIGAAVSEGATPSTSAVARAALTADDRGKTPLNRACERVCSLCAHVKERRQDSTSFRRSIAREDPFQDFGADSNDGRSSLLRGSRVGSGRRRIPGCGSSFRSSFSSSFVGGGADLGESLEGAGSTPRLRESFVSPRSPIHPIRGLELLDKDGHEELAKVELLARAASPEEGNIIWDVCETFSLKAARFTPPPPSEATSNAVSNVIVLGCAPEIVWHVATKYPYQVGEKDKFGGRTPLILACERFAAQKRWLSLTKESKESTEHDATSTVSKEVEEEESTNEDAMTDSDAARLFVQSLLLGENGSHLLDIAQLSTQSTPPQQQIQSLGLPERSSSMEMENESSSATSDNDLQEALSLSQEIIHILLYSLQFGNPEMASVPDVEGRLPLHMIIEACATWAEDSIYDGSEEGNHKNVAHALVDVYPRALEIRDGPSRLLPFMIAATPKALEEPNESEKECTKQLETIYHLLLKAPNAVSLCTRQEKAKL